jgi:hypothetical protein
MNNSKPISEPIATASSSPIISTASTGQSSPASSGNSSSQSSSNGSSSSTPNSNPKIISVGGDQKTESKMNEVVKENKDVTAG